MSYSRLHKHLTFGAPLALLAIASLWAGDTSAVGTRHFVIHSGADFKKGELEGTAVDSTGFLHAGFDLGSIEILEAGSVWSVLQHDGAVLLGTGNDGKLFQVKAGKASEVARVKDAIAITSIVRAFGKTLVGAMPGGKVYELSGDKFNVFTELPEAGHIWALSYDEKAQALFAATGPDGKLFRVTSDGTAQVYYDSPQGHLVTVLAQGGKVYAGSSGEARLYEITGPGRARVLYDFGSTEVRGIALGQDGSVFAIANELSGGPRSDSIDKIQRSSPQKGSSSRGKGVLYRFHPGGQPEELYTDSSDHFVSLDLDDSGRPLIGTGGEGRVIRVEPNHNHTVLADVDGRQIARVLGAKKGGFVVASDPVVVHPIEGVGGKDAVWTSAVLDAGLRARFGRLTWDATGRVEFSTRSGNTKDPDETWSDFSAPLSKFGVVTSESGRYLQVRVRLLDGDKTRVRRIDVPFVTDNLRPVLTKIEAKSRAQIDGSEGMQASGGPLDGKPQTSVKLSWEVGNPDQDALRYRVDYRLVEETDWFALLPVDQVLTSTSWDWNTENLPEGRYVVRVTASDEISNPISRVLTHQLESDVILVDNTPPQFSNVRVNKRTISGTVSDRVGPVQRIEMRIEGMQEWIPVEPKDGIFDDLTEVFEQDLAVLVGAEGALVTVRVFDTAGNAQVEHVRLPAAP